MFLKDFYNVLPCMCGNFKNNFSTRGTDIREQCMQNQKCLFFPKAFKYIGSNVLSNFALPNNVKKIYNWPVSKLYTQIV